MNARRLLLSSTLVVVLLIASAFEAEAATITIVNKDDPGVGFNDTTPAAPVGGNSGTTLGQQRLNAFQHAAGIWGAKLNSSIEIKIAAQFKPLTPCSSTSGVIGSAGATTYTRDFTGAPRSGTWYPVALASALAGFDFAGPSGFNLQDGASINASFNSNIGTADCLTNSSWYLGLDNNHGSQIDLVTTLLHEFAHGLGFAGLVSLSTGEFASGFPDVFAHDTLDNSVFLRWTAMSDAQRLTSLKNLQNVVLDGSNVTGGATTILSAGKDGANHPKLYTPSTTEQGSSIYHFDKSASPNQLMEPVINSDLTHNVDAPNDLTAKTLYDLGWPALGSVQPPTNVVATATSGTGVQVSWTASATGGVTGYKIYRSTDNSTFSLVGTVGAVTTFGDVVTANTAYMYVVRAVAGSESGDSNKDFAVAIAYTDPTLTAGTTTIKAAHLTQLRTAASALRTLAGQGGTSFAESIVAGTTTAKASHITELRTYISGARTALGFSSGTYTTTPGIGSIISVADIANLRTAAQ
jgi:hypothetical protein